MGRGLGQADMAVTRFASAGARWTWFRLIPRYLPGATTGPDAAPAQRAGLNYFRAIVNPDSFVGPPPSQPPTLGIWSSGRLRPDRGTDDPLGGACGRLVAL